VTSVNVDVSPVPTAADGVVIRHVRTHEEFAACVQLQRATWGADFNEVVPASMLKITQRLGGVTAGAFTDDGALLGFVFGITGVEDGHIVHWSDMLAVRDDVRGNGVGRRLKEFQRDVVRTMGVTRMYWTFDPLVARNAHFNLNRLGARVFEYVPDMYGNNTGSVLHSGFGTDRFIVTWSLTAQGPDASSGGNVPSESQPLPPMSSIPSLNPMFDASPVEREDHATHIASSRPPLLRVEIPSDIFEVNAASPATAKRWRAVTRAAFQWALANGYNVERFERGPAGVGSYVLARG
jgi:chorismate synthase